MSTLDESGRVPQARRRVLAGLAAAVLAADCGGGGDHVTLQTAEADAGTALPAPALPVLTGTVAVGAPVAGARVRARCASGELQTRSDAAGGYRLDLTTVRLPCALQASGGTVAGGAAAPTLHGVALEGGNAPIHALAELVLARATGASPEAAFDAGEVPDASALGTAARYVADQIEALGLARPQGDLWRGAFAIGDANDAVLDALAAKLEQNAVTLAGLVDTAARGGDLRAYVNADRLVAIEFVAQAAGQPVGCDSASIAGLGSGGVAARLQDLRFYVSAVELLRADGAAVPLRLAPNDEWQYTSAAGDGVTLVDLEDGSAGCGVEGTAPTHAVVAGSVPAGHYVGLRFTLGVPEALNHSDTATAPPPLDLTAMGWGWQAGRKFAKIEFSPPPGATWLAPGFVVHLGSTGCAGNPGLGTVVCSRPNRALVQFDAFDPATQRIALDLPALLAGTDITRNQAGAVGCMSSATDPECGRVFAALGIDWRADGSGSGQPLDDGRAQTVFRVVAR